MKEDDKDEIEKDCFLSAFHGNGSINGIIVPGIHQRRAGPSGQFQLP